MKWGVRRKATATKKHLKKKLTSYRKKTGRKNHQKLLNSTNAKYVYKNRSKLSDAELRSRVNRINTETQLKDLARKNRNVGSRAVSKILSRTGDAVLGAAIGYGMKRGRDYIKRKW